MAKDNFKIECRAQGIPATSLTSEQALQWVLEEEQFWAGFPALDAPVIVGNQNYGNQNILSSYRNYLANLRQRLQANDHEALRSFMDEAGQLRIVIAHGQLGGSIRELLKQNDATAAQRLVLLFSEAITTPREEIRRELVSLKVALRFNPLIQTTADTVSASHALKSAKVSEARVLELKDELNGDITEIKKGLEDFVDAKRKELEALHEQYETYLVLQGPSRHWKRVALSTSRAANIALGLFVALLATPAIFGFIYWDGISKYIDHIIDMTKGGISLASLVVFTVPVLAYGWLLKHVSRIFTQNLMLSSDAEHRRVMAVTFLGLAKRKSVGIAEQDRALILNALFRPAPTSPQDDGPPSGLLELIKK
ncbi:hypothetical protein FHT87_003127 [Rhizobium sp. BK316]|uniref:DUF6161 domain-containing protein n=1 Tax=Rhizobium sp. BK316 TaxID=2587053 RepID=UPI0016089112|nr:DUF6161 domain-containing protein [Rhizobium sp. BK316]MBB3409208.1 hypothetical protein [Rhizobium sp. BK316]